MSIVKRIGEYFTPKERIAFFAACVVFFISGVTLLGIVVREHSVFIPIAGGSYTEGIVGQPIMINPAVSSNPVDQDISSLIYSRLSDLLELPPEASADGRVYTLKLKQGLVWDDNQPLTADDVFFTLTTIQDPETQSPLQKNWKGVLVERVSEIQIRLTLSTPFAFLPENIARVQIIPKHIFGAIPLANLRLSSYNLQPVGNGPYKFENFSTRKDGFITDYRLTRNETYQGKTPFISEFVFRFYENFFSLLDDFEHRRIQGFGSATPLEKDLDSFSYAKVAAYPMSRYYAIFLNAVTNSALKERSVRQALAYAIDKKRIAREVLGDESLVAEIPFFPDSAAPEKASSSVFRLSSLPVLPYAPSEAQRILAASNRDITINLTLPDVDFLKQTAEIVRENWITAGIQDVTFTFLDTKGLQDAVRTRNYEAILFGNTLENPLDVFPFWHSSQRFYPGLNLSMFQSNDADRYIEELRQSSDRTKDGTRLTEIGRAILQDAPATFLFNAPYTYVRSRRLGGADSQLLAIPSDRFRDVTQWFMVRARVVQ